jgi:hypothetical protein
MVVERFEAGVMAVVCSKAGIEDGRWHDGFLGDRRVRGSAETKIC